MSDPIERDDANVAEPPGGVTAASPSSPVGSGQNAPDDDANALLETWRERGYITTGELFAAFPNLEPETDDLRNLYELIESKGLKILDEIAEELQLEDQRRAGARIEPDLDDVA